MFAVMKYANIHFGKHNCLFLHPLCVCVGGGGGGGCVGSLFCGMVSSCLAIILLRKRELVALILFVFRPGFKLSPICRRSDFSLQEN